MSPLFYYFEEYPYNLEITFLGVVRVPESNPYKSYKHLIMHTFHSESIETSHFIFNLNKYNIKINT